MSRKVEYVKVPHWPDASRDGGKSFCLTEWPAARAERWGIKMLLAFNRGEGAQLPLNVGGLGMEGVFILGINTFLRGNIRAEEITPILDELLECVTIVRDPGFPDVATPIATDDDIEEIKTRLWLRSEVLRIHTNFSLADAAWSLIAAITTPPSPSM